MTDSDEELAKAAFDAMTFGRGYTRVSRNGAEHLPIAEVEKATPKLYGWYDRPDQAVDQPTYNPEFPGPCLFCGDPTSEEDVRTHALMLQGGQRSFFYRTHRTCHENAGDDYRVAIDRVVWDSIEYHGDLR